MDTWLLVSAMILVLVGFLMYAGLTKINRLENQQKIIERQVQIIQAEFEHGILLDQTGGLFRPPQTQLPISNACQIRPTPKKDNLAAHTKLDQSDHSDQSDNSDNLDPIETKPPLSTFDRIFGSSMVPDFLKREITSCEVLVELNDNDVVDVSNFNELSSDDTDDLSLMSKVGEEINKFESVEKELEQSVEKELEQSVEKAVAPIEEPEIVKKITKPRIALKKKAQ